MTATHLSEAWSIAQHIGAASIRDAVEKLAARARIRLAKRSPEAPDPAASSTGR